MTVARPPSNRASDVALVLRRYAYGESSLVVHALTRDHGRLNLLAKGAYRPKSAYSGVLDLFDTLRVEWRGRPGSDLAVLSAGAIERRRRSVPADLERYDSALSALELAAMGAREGHEERELFALLESCLDALAAGESPPSLVGTTFELKFLAAQGLTPALVDCASCGAPPADLAPGSAGVPFAPALGGRLCERCAGEAARDARRCPVDVLRVADSLLETPFAQLSRVHLAPQRTAQLRGFVRRFLEYHLESRPRAWGPVQGARRPRRGRMTR